MDRLCRDRRRECVNVCLCDRQGRWVRVRETQELESIWGTAGLCSVNKQILRKPCKCRDLFWERCSERSILSLSLCLSIYLNIRHATLSPLHLPIQVCRFFFTSCLFLSPLTDPLPPPPPRLGLLWVRACLNSLASIAVIHSIYQQPCKLTFQGFPNWLIPDKLSKFE